MRLPVGERGVVYLSLGPGTGGDQGPVTYYFPLVPAEANISAGPQARSYFFGQVTNLFADGKVDIVLSRGTDAVAVRERRRGLRVRVPGGSFRSRSRSFAPGPGPG